tara:strand:+ start:2835 stop:3230 length:396 start_codon:yes stop_codon:yes gene_type:complete
LDIVEGRVDINNVLVVVSRTDIDPLIDDEWDNVWAGYVNRSIWSATSEWGNYDVDNVEHKQKFRTVAIDLVARGKLHQPRKFGVMPVQIDKHWLETCLPISELDCNPAAKEAWDRFQIVAGLSGIAVNPPT